MPAVWQTLQTDSGDSVWEKQKCPYAVSIISSPKSHPYQRDWKFLDSGFSFMSIYKCMFLIWGFLWACRKVHKSRIQLGEFLPSKHFHKISSQTKQQNVTVPLGSWCFSSCLKLLLIIPVNLLNYFSWLLTSYSNFALFGNLQIWSLPSFVQFYAYLMPLSCCIWLDLFIILTIKLYYNPFI